MRLFIVLIALFALSCKHQSKDLPVPTSDTSGHPGDSNNTVHPIVYPDTVIYKGAMQLESWHEDNSSGATFHLDTVFQNPPVMVVYSDSAHMEITFGYWDCHSFTDRSLYYSQVIQPLKVSDTHIYTYDPHFSNRYCNDTLQNDSLKISSSYHSGNTFAEVISYRGKRQ